MSRAAAIEWRGWRVRRRDRPFRRDHIQRHKRINDQLRQRVAQY